MLVSPVAPISPLWGQTNPFFLKRMRKLAYFPAGVVTDYIDSPKDTNFAVMRTGFTLKCFIQPDSWAATYNSYIFSWGSAYNSNWAFRVYHNDASQIIVDFSTNGSAIAASMDSDVYAFPADGVGIYLAITYRNTTSAGKIYVSLDNHNWTSITALSFGGTKTLFDSTSSFRIGGGVVFGADPGFKGYIGQVTVNGTYDNLNSSTSSNFSLNCDPSFYLSGTTFTSPIIAPYNTMTWTNHGNVSMLQV